MCVLKYWGDEIKGIYERKIYKDIKKLYEKYFNLITRIPGWFLFGCKLKKKIVVVKN